jgi:hypothetical protein
MSGWRTRRKIYEEGAYGVALSLPTALEWYKKAA